MGNNSLLHVLINMCPCMQLNMFSYLQRMHNIHMYAQSGARNVRIKRTLSFQFAIYTHSLHLSNKRQKRKDSSQGTWLYGSMRESILCQLNVTIFVIFYFMHFHKQSDKILILNLFYQDTLSLAVELLPHSHLTFIIPSSHPPKRVSAIVTVSIAGIL